MRRASLALLLALIAAAACAVAPRPAAAAYPTWDEGLSGGRPFSLATPVSAAIAVDGTADQSLSLARKKLSELAAIDPRMAYPLANGHVIVCGGQKSSSPFVRELDATGQTVWEYRNGEDGVLIRPFSAEPAVFGGRWCILISDRGKGVEGIKVFAVSWDAAKETLWQYGGAVGGGPNQLDDPFCATQIPKEADQVSGNVLIADSNEWETGGHRVIEVRADDYDASAPYMGYTAGSIVWQYGVTGQSGTAPGYLEQVRSPQRLDGGRTLITDSRSARILLIDDTAYDPAKAANGYTAENILWSYDSSDGELFQPNTARYVERGPLAGCILISDAFTDEKTDVNRVKAVRMDDSKETVWSFETGETSSPRDARISPQNGSMWIALNQYDQVLQMGNEGSGIVTSTPLSCGYPKLLKAFDRIKVETPAQPSGTGLKLWFSTDGGKSFKALKRSSDGKNYAFPPGAAGKTLVYRVELTSSDRWATPVLDGLVIHFAKAKTGGNGGGGGGDKPGGSGNSGQSGTYTYPTPAAAVAPPAAYGGTGTSGTGSGAGSAGAGSGSGTYGTGAGTSAAAGSGSSVTAANPVDVPVQSTGSGVTENVQGYQVQGAEGVSGVPLRAAEGAQAPEPERPGPALPVVALVAAGLFVAAAFFIPWPFVAAHLRAITGFDHTRPKGVLPFRPLGK